MARSKNDAALERALLRRGPRGRGRLSRSSRLGGRQKVHRVMGEFKRGTLRSSGGGRVTRRDQAIAIALSEAGLSRRGRG